MVNVMANDVFANGREIACKAADGKSICAFPDVCMTPPECPATPPGVPIPYPNTAFAKDTTKGSKNVKISGKEVMLKNKSYFKKSTGDEAGCAQKKGVITSKITGKVYFNAWSMDVKFEGQNVVRHFDLTTHNHGSQPANEAAPWLYVDSMAPGTSSQTDDDRYKCPCCGGPLHENQKDGEGEPLKRITQEQYYAKKKAVIDKKISGFDDWAAKNKSRLNEIWPLDFGSNIYGTFSGTPAQIATEEARRAKQMLDELNHLTATNPDCPNVHNPQNEGCGTHFNLPPGKNTKAQRKEFENKHRDAFIQFWNRSYPNNPVPPNTSIHHMTPLDAGGCPSGGDSDNGFPGLVPDHILNGPCAKIEKIQTALQGR